MDALVPGQVDARRGQRDRCSQPLDQAVRVGDHGEHRPVVVGVGVHVEDAGAAPAEGIDEGVEHALVASLREVRDGLEQTVHQTPAPGDSHGDGADALRRLLPPPRFARRRSVKSTIIASTTPTTMMRCQGMIMNGVVSTGR
jgi:hypothetical protein